MHCKQVSQIGYSQAASGLLTALPHDGGWGIRRDRHWGLLLPPSSTRWAQCGFLVEEPCADRPRQAAQGYRGGKKKTHLLPIQGKAPRYKRLWDPASCHFLVRGHGGQRSREEAGWAAIRWKVYIWFGC